MSRNTEQGNYRENVIRLTEYMYSITNREGDRQRKNSLRSRTVNTDTFPAAIAL
ncbi:MAG: hypothetical protein HC890_02775 [Chloroflexaceae bacterium]|nr:hypothetical protein [Chloroflexaceae bacterium]